MNDPAYLPFARTFMDDALVRDLPEEVREALEAHKDEIHSAADLRSLANDLMLKS